MYKITDQAGFRIYATFHNHAQATRYAKDHGLVCVEVVFCNDHNSLIH